MKASILLITYNQEDTISRSIESLLRQECEYDWEIIISDDASTDSTREICQQYALRYPERIRLLDKVPNMGLVGNYFRALEATKGEYIGDCAGDDEWVDPSRLRRQIEILDSDPNLTVCFCDVEVREKDRKTYLHSEDKRRNKWFKNRVSGRNLLLATLNHTRSLPYTLSAALYRKSVIEDLYRKKREIVRNEESGVEDVTILAALAAAGDGEYLPVIGLRYHISGESVSNNLSFEKEYKFYSRILRLTLKLADYYGVKPSYLKKHFNSKIIHISTQARHTGNKALIKEIRDIAYAWHRPIPLRGKVHLLLLKLK